jgi:hypothetical protein
MQLLRAALIKSSCPLATHPYLRALGMSTYDFSNVGVNNFKIFDMKCSLIKRGLGAMPFGNSFKK